MFYGHVNELKEGHWKQVEWNKGQIVYKKDDLIALRSNVCPHQGSLIRTEQRGKGLASVCPYHGWSWDAEGNPKGQGTVGHTERSSKCINDKPLSEHNIYTWNGFMFGVGILNSHLNISGEYKLEEYRVDIIKANSVPIMDLFLDIDHIPVVHPGVYDKIDIPKVDTVKWIQNFGSSTQIVSDENGNLGALWMALYPNVMFEWQPGAVFVMVNKDTNDEGVTESHIYKYRDYSDVWETAWKPYDDKLWKLNSDVWETAWEQDKLQAEALEPHWRDVPDSNLDDEKLRYRQWLKR
jgi:nitrite reductase/ring-hydroxylating ferredoxin subunit